MAGTSSLLQSEGTQIAVPRGTEAAGAGRDFILIVDGAMLKIYMEPFGGGVRTFIATVDLSASVAGSTDTFDDATHPHAGLRFTSAGDIGTRFTDIRLDPVPSTALVVVAEGSTPPGTSLLFELDDSLAGTNWVTVANRDTIGVDNTATGGQDLSSVIVQDTYNQRCALTPDASGVRTPILTRMGIRSVTETNLGPLVRAPSGSRHAIDPMDLVGQITALDIFFARGGAINAADVVTQIFSQNDLVNLELLIWWGHEDLARQDWLHWDSFLIEDIEPAAGGLVVKCYNMLALVRGLFPRPTGSPLQQTDYTQQNKRLSFLAKTFPANLPFPPNAFCRRFKTTTRSPVGPLPGRKANAE